MDEENKNEEIEQPVEEVKEEVVQEIKEEPVKESSGNFFTKAINFVVAKWKLFAAAVAAIVAIIIIIAIASGAKMGPVKKYINAMAKGNAKKVLSVIDFAGEEAFTKIASKFDSYDDFVKDFDKDDFNEFKDAYKDVDKDDLKEAKEEAEKYLEDSFDEMKDKVKSCKIKINKVKNAKKLKGGICAIEVKLDILTKFKDKDTKDVDKTDTYKFVKYKVKIIYYDLLMYEILGSSFF